MSSTSCSFYGHVELLSNLIPVMVCCLNQDAANRSGGKWIIRYKKLVSGRYWEDLVEFLSLLVVLVFAYDSSVDA